MIPTVPAYDALKNYYGTVIQKTSDLKTTACCSDPSGGSAKLRALLDNIHGEILAKSYGCGSPLPDALEGCTVLDLGCGAGRDVYVAAQLVGPTGRVIGVDMTAEQLDVARKHVRTQTKVFGFDTPNVDFREGYMEDLAAIGVEDNSVDVVISNCVLNLSPDKEAVFREIFRVLKPGGELFFADVFADRRVPAHLHSDPVLLGECLSGAMYKEDFRRLMTKVGFHDFRMLEESAIELGSPEIEAKVGMVHFTSRTIRAFKIERLEDICEDYGQVAIYRGSVDEHPHFLDLDDHHRFFTGKPMLVCGNTAAMIEDTRFAKHFTVSGDRSTHYGAFDCAPAAEKADGGGGCAGGACC